MTQTNVVSALPTGSSRDNNKPYFFSMVPKQYSLVKTGQSVYPQDLSPSHVCSLARHLSPIHSHSPAMGAGPCGGGRGKASFPKHCPRKCNLLCVSMSPPFPNKEQLGENLYP